MNWTRDEINPGEDFTLTADESFFTEGLKSLHMQLNSGAVPYLVSDVFNITPGTEYEFSIDVFDNDTAGSVKVYADFYDTYGFNVFGQPPVLSTDSSAWQTISWQGTIPSQAVVGYIQIKFYTQPEFYNFTRKAEVWIDHVQFNEDGIGNLLINGSFEAWNVGIEDPGLILSTLNIHPNPFISLINLELPVGSKEVYIFDITGRQKYHKDVRGLEELRINTQDYQEAIYLIEILLNNGNILRGKVVKI